MGAQEETSGAEAADSKEQHGRILSKDNVYAWTEAFQKAPGEDPRVDAIGRSAVSA